MMIPCSHGRYDFHQIITYYLGLYSVWSGVMENVAIHHIDISGVNNILSL